MITGLFKLKAIVDYWVYVCWSFFLYVCPYCELCTKFHFISFPECDQWDSYQNDESENKGKKIWLYDMEVVT